MRILRNFLVISCLFISPVAWSQHSPKLSVYTGTGFSYFGGRGATGNSTYYRNGLSFPDAIDTIRNHFGSMARQNFIAGLQLEYPLSPAWTLLFSTQYENTGSRLRSDSIITPSGNYKTDGTYSGYHDFISVNPQIGRAVRKGKLAFILHGGIDYCFKLDRGDKFEFTDQAGKKFSIGHSGGRPEVNDFRISIGGMVTLKKWSLDLNYKHGLANYNTGGEDKVSSRLLHFKLMYSLFKM